MICNFEIINLLLSLQLYNEIIFSIVYQKKSNNINHYQKPNTQQGWGQVQYLYLSTYLSVLDVLEYLVYGNVKVLVLVLDQKVLGT